MSSAIEYRKSVEPVVGALIDSDGQEPDVFDRAIDKLLSKSSDKLGTLWAILKILEEKDGTLKAAQDRISLCRRHIGATRDRLRQMATAILLEMEVQGQEPSVKRPEFSAHLHSSQSVEGPARDEDWPELLQKRTLVVKADRAAALARLKAGEAFEGLKLITSRVIKFA